MNFELTFTAEQESFRAEVRSWLEEHAPKDMEHPADPGQLRLEGYRKQRQLGRALGTERLALSSVLRRNTAGVAFRRKRP